MIEQLDTFVDALARAGLYPGVEEIRDALWLSRHIVVGDAPVHPAALAPPAEAPPSNQPAPTASYLDIEPRTVAESAPGADMYAAGSKSAASMHGMAVRSPAVSALRHKAALVRALRPLKRTTASTTSFVVDENATAEQVASEGLWLPVLRPAPERWLDLTLVVDTAASMSVWHRTIGEFRTLTEQLGAFRRIRVVELNGDDTGVATVELESHSCATSTDPATLVDPAERQVILVITDGVGGGWRSGRIQPYLRRWAQHGTVAIATVLPQRMWAGSGLNVVGGQVMTWRPGVPNAQWHTRSDGSVPIPVLGLSARWLTPWAQLVSGAGGRHNTALLTVDPRPERASSPPTTRSAADIVNAFRAVASPTAFRLACYLSAAWLNPPVMRLVQQLMLPDSEVSHLAEVFLGGLLRRVGDADSDPDVAQYEFAPGVRDELNNYLTRDELLTVVERSSRFVTERFGQAFDFAAVLADPEGVELPAVGSAGARPLAHISASVLAKLGGRYKSLSQRVASSVHGAAALPSQSGSVADGLRDSDLAEGDSPTSGVPAPAVDGQADEPSAASAYLTALLDLVSRPEALDLDRQHQILDELEPALRSADPSERQRADSVLDILSSREDLYAVVDRRITQLRSPSEQLSPRPSVTPSDESASGPTGWQSMGYEIFWDHLLGHIDDQRLVPVVGSDLVVTVGNAEQTLDAYIGQRLAERYDLAPGPTTIGEAVAALLRERGRDELDRLYPVINGIIAELDPAPGRGLGDLAAIDDLRLFVSMTPDRLLARALNEVRFQGRSVTRELVFSPNQSTVEEFDVRQAAPTDTIVLSLFGHVSSTPVYAIHEEDRLEWLHAYLSGTASLPEWLDNRLKHQPMLFIGCEMSDWLVTLLLRLWSTERLYDERKQFFFVGTAGLNSPSLSDFFATYSRRPLVQQLEMEPTAFVTELRQRWEAQSARPPTAAGDRPAQGIQERGSIFISYMREDADAARRLADAIAARGGDVSLDDARLHPGDTWEREVLSAIGTTIRLFIPIISANTERADEGHVFREWREAAERARFVLDRRFIVPVVIDEDFDGDPSRYRNVPQEFYRLVFGRAPSGEPDALLDRMLRDEIRAMRRIDSA